jgi:cytochrome b561
MSAVARYDGVAIALHWAVAVAIFCTFPLGLYMADLPPSPSRLELVSYHRWIGITVLALAGVRLTWRLSHRPPALPASMPAWQRRAAGIAHGALYALIVAAPLSGWTYSSAAGEPTVYLGLWRLPDLIAPDEAAAKTLKLVHQGLNFALLAIVVVHVAAAIKHQFVDRDGLLGRMLPGGAHLGSSGSGGSERR